MSSPECQDSESVPTGKEENGAPQSHNMYLRELNGYFPKTDHNSPDPTSYNDWKTRQNSTLKSRLGRNLQMYEEHGLPSSRSTVPHYEENGFDIGLAPSRGVDERQLENRVTPRRFIESEVASPPYERQLGRTPQRYDHDESRLIPRRYESGYDTMTPQRYCDGRFPPLIEERELESRVTPQYVKSRHSRHNTPMRSPIEPNNGREFLPYPYYQCYPPPYLHPMSPRAADPRYLPSCHCTPPSPPKRKPDKTRKHITDLFKIVQLQNEQITRLQSQVGQLSRQLSAMCKSEVRPAEKPPVKEMRSFNLSVIEENRTITEKVSVGIMTSFVDNLSSRSGTTSSSDDEPKSNKKREDTIHLQGVNIPTFVDSPPSPQSSIHIEMQEYKSSSDTDSSSCEDSEEDEEEEKEQKVGWTYYDNVVGKVNDLLRNDSEEDAVRAMTLERIRRLGVSIVDSGRPDKTDTYKRVTFGEKAHIETDTSVRMNALAMKYLDTGKGLPEKRDDVNLTQGTMKYLENYRMPSEPKKDASKKKKKKEKHGEEKKQRKTCKTRRDSGKILDITAIKRQPKLLPKPN